MTNDPRILTQNSREEQPGTINPLMENSRAQDHDGRTFFMKSEKGDQQSIADDVSDEEASRAGGNYPSITLGKFRQSS